MEDADIKREFHLLHKEVEAAVALVEDTKLNLLSALDNLRIEIEIFKRFMEHHHSDFTRFYPQIREAVIQEVDPEWLEKTTQSKNVVNKD